MTITAPATATSPWCHLLTVASQAPCICAHRQTHCTITFYLLLLVVWSTGARCSPTAAPARLSNMDAAVAFNSHPIPEDVIGEPTPVGLIQRHTTPLVQPHPLGLAVAARTRPRCSTPPPPPPAVAAAVAEGAEWEDISDLFGAEGGALPMAPVGLAQLESLRVEMAAATPSPAPAAAAAAGQANPAAAPGK
jgi:hypothetical protein